ncbi:MBL fold metallo-hydrolase [Malaciobacter molluscorum LMG 25693]|uniref:MBL fold metallo-hydrolase n=1 Tax=Malaciobacter molluscorum LMG 25693 TaxID=870501 RepID=A0A2G1DI94_9BACT|nr:MBL fold metallo-hydrolase [Malaciobacter molluscorum]AXX92342.1 metallo-beta-lactamase family protein [Malaciobacter molluscorum LMG 25693]PHO18207.1 MBL fold metallo-hydrolase [Malaciobacter molluscorum LMG 25693]RXJ93996.1 MBL fold metallo-hydrolase [Malaciobacter molluscorum]
MQIKKQQMGDYQTNCYIVTIDNKDLIIDPGVNATPWVKQNVTNPIAILNTHGHFDHVWSNKELSEDLNIKIYCPKNDEFMLKNDPYGLGMKPSKADVLVEPDEEFDFDGIKVKFHFFPGHTPGCSAIEIENNLFTGDFIFKNSIGRCDFPFSNPNDMKNSIIRILKWDKNFRVYPGHGSHTTLFQEKESLKAWLNYL